MYYNSGAVSVNGDFARFGSKSYAIDKINTVDVRERKPFDVSGAIVSALIAIVVIPTGLFSFSLTRLLIGLVFGVLAYLAYKRSLIRVYGLFLTTSSSDVQAYESQDREEVHKLRAAVEAAMVAR